MFTTFGQKKKIAIMRVFLCMNKIFPV